VFMRFIILALLIIPALEIGVFIWAGSIIGPWWVVGLILLTGFIGIAIAKQQGMETWFRARQAINMGQPPAEEIVDGISIFIGAVVGRLCLFFIVSIAAAVSDLMSCKACVFDDDSKLIYNLSEIVVGII